MISPKALCTPDWFAGPNSFKSLDGTPIRLKDVKNYELEDIKLEESRKITGTFTMNKNLYHLNSINGKRSVQWVYSFTLSQDLQTIEHYLELNRDQTGEVVHSEEYSNNKLMYDALVSSGHSYTGTCRLL